MARKVEALLGALARMRLNEQVLLDHQRGKGDDLGALGHFILRLVEGEQQNLLESLGDLGDFLAGILYFAIGHEGLLSYTMPFPQS